MKIIQIGPISNIYMEKVKEIVLKAQPYEYYLQGKLGSTVNSKGDSFAAADYLFENDGISVEVVDPRTLRPLDKETLISSVCKTGRCLVVHEANTFGGFGAEIAAMLADLAFDKIKAPIKRIGALETPVPVSPSLEVMVIPNKQRIVETVYTLLR